MPDTSSFDPAAFLRECAAHPEQRFYEITRADLDALQAAYPGVVLTDFNHDLDHDALFGLKPAPPQAAPSAGDDAPPPVDRRCVIQWCLPGESAFIAARDDPKAFAARIRERVAARLGGK